MKRIAVILSTIILGLLLHSQLARAQTIYKWIDEKGTTNYSEDPNAVPEKYKNKAQKKDIDEFPPLLFYTPKRPQSYSGEPSTNRTERSSPVRSGERSRPVRRIESESIDSSPRPGHVPFEKFIHIKNGMGEAEVLSRLGPPTKEEITGKTTTGSVSGGTLSGVVSPGGSVSGTVSGGSFSAHENVVKKYYYLGDFDKSEKTTVITFSGGRVVNIARISSPHW